MTGAAHANYAVTAIVLAGGVFAFVKTKSKASLIGSSVLATLFYVGT